MGSLNLNGVLNKLSWSQVTSLLHLAVYIYRIKKWLVKREVGGGGEKTVSRPEEIRTYQQGVLELRRAPPVRCDRGPIIGPRPVLLISIFAIEGVGTFADRRKGQTDITDKRVGGYRVTDERAGASRLCQKHPGSRVTLRTRVEQEI